MTRRALATFLVALLSVSFVAGPTLAEPTDDERTAARNFGRAAIGLYNEGKFAEALDRFERAELLVGALPTTALWIGRCHEKLGHLVEASERYLQAARAKLGTDALPQHVNAQKDAVSEREALLVRIPKLTVIVRESVATSEAMLVKLDGRRLNAALIGIAIPVNPGTHHIVASRGAARAGKSFEIQEKEKLTVELILVGGEKTEEPAPKPATKPISTTTTEFDTRSTAWPAVGWVMVGVGSAGLVMGAVTTTLAADKRSTLQDGCVASQCGAELHSTVDSYDLLRNLSSAGWIAGGVLVTAGVTVLITAPRSTEVALVPTLHGAALWGRF